MKRINRRSFIKKSTALSATSLLGSGLFSRLLGGHGFLLAGDNIDISVAKGKDYFKNTIKAVEQLGGMEKFVPKKSSVAVLANPQRNNPGSFTSPDVVRAVIRMCREAGAEKVVCVSMLPEKNWNSTGLAAVVEEEGGELQIVNLRDESLFKPVPIPKGVALKEAKIMKEFFKYDVFIDVPVTKDHAGNKFTGTMKNLMGINSPQSNRMFHKQGWKTDVDSITHLDQCIADLNTIIIPDLCVVDATEFIITNGPFGPGKLFSPQKVVAGTDRVAIDSYCCTLWGLKPEDIIMINAAFKHKLGEMNLDKVRIREIDV